MTPYLVVALVAFLTVFPALHDLRKYGAGALFAPSAFFFLYGALWIVGLDVYLLATNLSGPDFDGLSEEEAKSLFVRANWLIVLFHCSWIAGYWYFLYGRQRQAPVVVFPLGPSLSNGVLAVITLGVAGALFVLAGVLRPEEGSRSQMTAGAAGKVLFLLVVALFALSATFFSRVTSSRRGRAGWSRVTLAILVTVGCFAALAILEGRARALSIFFFVLAIVHYNYRPIPLKTLVIAFVAMIAAALGYSIYERGGVSRLEVDTVLAAVPFVMYDKHFSRNFDFVENICLLLRAFDEGKLAFTFGINAVADVLRDLSIDTGIQETRTLFLEQAFGKYNVEYGHPITKVGEGYLTAGVAGVIVFGTLCGSLSGLAFRYLVVQRSIGALSVAVYISILVNLRVADANGYMWASLVLDLVSVLALLLVGTIALGYVRKDRRYLTAPST